MTNLLARVRTVLGAAVAWLVLISAVLTAVLAELSDYVDQPVVAVIVQYVGGALTVITVVVLIVRRVTTVIPADRGLLPVDNPTPVNSTLGKAIAHR